MIDPMRRITYRLMEGNSNNPANLLVGQDITVYHYKDGEIDSSEIYTLELITNEYIILKDKSGNSRNFKMIGFNNSMNGIEFDDMKDPNYKIFV